MDDVVFANAENPLAEQLGSGHETRMDVLDGLWISGRARSVKPTGHLVGQSVRDERGRVGSRNEIFEALR